MNVVDSSCWLEFFAGTETGEIIAPVVEKLEELLVPSITIYEVFKKLVVELDEDRAILAAAHMKQARVVDLDSDLAIFAGMIGKEHKLSMADSIIYATCKKNDAVLWTQDKHFKTLDGVRYFEKS